MQLARAFRGWPCTGSARGGLNYGFSFSANFQNKPCPPPPPRSNGSAPYHKGPAVSSGVQACITVPATRADPYQARLRLNQELTPSESTIWEVKNGCLLKQQSQGVQTGLKGDPCTAITVEYNGCWGLNPGPCTVQSQLQYKSVRVKGRAPMYCNHSCSTRVWGLKGGPCTAGTACSTRVWWVKGKRPMYCNQSCSTGCEG